MSNSVRPHRRQPTRRPHPWESPGKNIGVGCHFLLQCMKMKSESEVAQSCQIFSDSENCSLPGSSVHGIFQARVLEWGSIAFSESGHTNLLQLSSDPTSNRLSPIRPLPFQTPATSPRPPLLLTDWLVFGVFPGFGFHHLLEWLAELKEALRIESASQTQSGLTLCDPMDCSPPGSSVLGILQARILEWVAMPFSRGSSQPRDLFSPGLLHCRQILYHLSHQGITDLL